MDAFESVVAEVLWRRLLGSECRQSRAHQGRQVEDRPAVFAAMGIGYSRVQQQAEGVAELERENETLLNEVLDEPTPREVRQPQELVDGGPEALERAMRYFLDQPFVQKG